MNETEDRFRGWSNPISRLAGGFLLPTLLAIAYMFGGEIISEGSASAAAADIADLSREVLSVLLWGYVFAFFPSFFFTLAMELAVLPKVRSPLKVIGIGAAFGLCSGALIALLLETGESAFLESGAFAGAGTALVLVLVRPHLPPLDAGGEERVTSSEER